MSLTYLSNSTILSYLEKMGIKMDLFYKTLWKHVFIIELLKLYSGSDQGKMDNLIDWFVQKFTAKDQSKKKVLDYLHKWKGSFWLNIEYKIKEMESTVSEKLAEKLGIKSQQLLPFLAELEDSHEKSTSQTIKTEVINKSQIVVNELQIQEINEMIKRMKSDLFDKRKARFFILVDDLDKEWVDNKIVYDLIKTMIDAIKELKVIEGTKIVIALRENLLRLVINKSKSRGFQQEKYESLYLKLKWSEPELRELVEKRISLIFKGKYAQRHIKVEDVFRISNDKSQSALDYILQRTLLRPRDVIDFVNKCIEEGDGKSLINGEMIKAAELRYSKSRVKAVEDEWVENYPHIVDFVNILSGCNESFDLTKFRTRTEEYLSVNKCELLYDTTSTPLGRMVNDYNDGKNMDSLVKYILTVLYEVGVIGIKVSGEESVKYSYLHYEAIEANQLTDKSNFYIHKAFHKALHTNTNSRNNS